jgi:hypothetical protein
MARLDTVEVGEQPTTNSQWVHSLLCPDRWAKRATKEKKMKVNFNNARLQAIYAYNRLCKVLNTNIGKSNGEGMVVVAADEIQEHMDDLHNTLVTIGCTYDEGNEGFKCVLTDDVSVDNFNPEDEERADEGRLEVPA